MVDLHRCRVRQLIHSNDQGRFVEVDHPNQVLLARCLAKELSYRRKDDSRRLRVEIAIRAIASEFTIA